MYQSDDIEYNIVYLDPDNIEYQILEDQLFRIEGASKEAQSIAAYARRVYNSLPDVPSSEQDREVVRTLLSLLSPSGALDPQEPVGVEHCLLIESHILRLEAAAIQGEVITQQAKEIYRSATEGNWSPSERNQFLWKLLELLSSGALEQPIRGPIGEEHYQIIQLYNSVVRANEIMETEQPTNTTDTEYIDVSDDDLDEADDELDEGADELDEDSEMVDCSAAEQKIDTKVEHWGDVDSLPCDIDYESEDEPYPNLITFS